MSQPQRQMWNAFPVKAEEPDMFLLPEEDGPWERRRRPAASASAPAEEPVVLTTRLLDQSMGGGVDMALALMLHFAAVDMTGSKLRLCPDEVPGRGLFEDAMDELQEESARKWRVKKQLRELPPPATAEEKEAYSDLIVESRKAKKDLEIANRAYSELLERWPGPRKFKHVIGD